MPNISGRVPLAPSPAGIDQCGTTNTLAYEFGIPQDPLKAIGVLTSPWVTVPIHTVPSVGRSQRADRPCSSPTLDTGRRSRRLSA